MTPVSPIDFERTSARCKASHPEETVTYQLPGIHLEPKNICQIRDSWVYGKFDQANERLKAIPRKDEEEDDVIVLQRLISDVYGYLRVILTAYLRDKNLGIMLR